MIESSEFCVKRLRPGLWAFGQISIVTPSPGAGVAWDYVGVEGFHGFVF